MQVDSVHIKDTSLISDTLILAAYFMLKVWLLHHKQCIKVKYKNSVT